MLKKLLNFFGFGKDTEQPTCESSKTTTQTFVIPVKGNIDVVEELDKLLRDYSTDVSFDETTGEVEVNGVDQIPFTNEIHIPSPGTGTPVTETLTRVEEPTPTSSVESTPPKKKRPYKRRKPTGSVSPSQPPTQAAQPKRRRAPKKNKGDQS